jgi:hypothetical protein
MYDFFYIVSDFLAIPTNPTARRQPPIGDGQPMTQPQEPTMIPRFSRCLAAAAASLALLAITPLAMAQVHAAAPAHGDTAKMQGNDEQAWINDPHMHAWFETTKAAFAAGPGKVDADAYEQKSFAIFRDFAPTMHMSAEGMVDHLKLIPRQVVQIVKEDPHVLDSYDNFVAATFGPR